MIRREVVGPNPMENIPGFAFADWPFSPTGFEITLLLDGVPYVYALWVRNGTVLRESLSRHAGPGKRWRTVFSRTLDENTPGRSYHYVYGAGFGTGRKVLEARTGADHTFLGTAALFAVKAVEPVYTWFRDLLCVVTDDKELNALGTIEKMANAPAFKDAVLRFLRAADPSLSAIGLELYRDEPLGRAPDPRLGEAPTQDGSGLLLVSLAHRSPKRLLTLSLGEEALGLRRLLHLAGFFVPGGCRNRTLCLDNLEAGLHPTLTESLLRDFQSADAGPSAPQLLFTSHGDFLLDNDTARPDAVLLRRDQIWLTEKNAEQASLLTCLDDLGPRKAESIRRGYRLGRYKARRAVPQDLS